MIAVIDRGNYYCETGTEETGFSWQKEAIIKDDKAHPLPKMYRIKARFHEHILWLLTNRIQE